MFFDTLHFVGSKGIGFVLGYMRSRSLSTTLPITQKIRHDNQTGVDTPQGNDVVIETESHMWDEAGQGRKFKPCVHVSYLAECPAWSHVDNIDTSNAPNPRTEYRNVIGIPYDTYRPSNTLAAASSYIPVTPNTSDDIGQCVFNAYNQFVNGVRALDASVSLAEIQETPGLFSLWQRRLSAPHNIVNGFLNYSFGWKPVLNDLRAIARELRSFPKTVRKRLKAIGDGEVVRHFKFRLDNTVDDLTVVHAEGQNAPYPWGRYVRKTTTRSKSRVVVVTIRANVKPKLGPEGQAILNKLGALGLVPSLATLWSVTRLSFVIDWFYNIGGAIENLQGSLTHDISNVRVGVSDLRRRKLSKVFEDTGGNPQEVAVITQGYYKRELTQVPMLPSVTYPRRVMPYVLLSAIVLANSKVGRNILSKGPKLNVDLSLDALRNKLKRGEILLR